MQYSTLSTNILVQKPPMFETMSKTSMVQYPVCHELTFGVLKIRGPSVSTQRRQHISRATPRLRDTHIPTNLVFICPSSGKTQLDFIEKIPWR